MTAPRGSTPPAAQSAGPRQRLLPAAALVAAVTIVVTLIVLTWSLLQTPVYSATAQVLIGPSGQSESGGDVVSTEEVSTQQLVATSEPVLLNASQALGGTVTPATLGSSVTVQPVADTRVLAFTVDATGAQESAGWSNAIAGSYTSYRNEQARRRAAATREELSSLTADLTERLATIDRLLQGPAGPSDTALLTEQRSLEAQLGQVSAQLQSFFDASRAPAAPAQLLNTADPPGSPTSPQPFLYTGLGLVFGLLLGLAIALVAGRSRQFRTSTSVPGATSHEPSASPPRSV